MNIRRWILLAALSASPLSAQRTDESLVVTTEWLGAHLADASLVVLHVTHNMGSRGDFVRGHIPGARELNYMEISQDRLGISTELPPRDVSRATFEALGISQETQVVVYASEAPMATRAIFTLRYLGLTKVALLDGGLPRWVAEHRPVSTTVPSAPVLRGKIADTPNPRTDLVVDADWILPKLGVAGTAFVDTRTDEEYDGSGGRRGMPSAGHLAGARQIEWEDLFTGPERLQLKSRGELEALFTAVARPQDVIVTYCWVGYRASATWLVAALLGYDARLYDGSYQDWLKRALPVRAGKLP